MDWVDSLPDFWQPVANGALFIIVWMGLRAVVIVPLAVVAVLFGARTPLPDVLRALALIPLAIIAGALSGLTYSLIGRLISTVPRIGPYAAGFVAGTPYAAFLVFASRWLDRQPILIYDGSEWIAVLLCGVLGALIIGDDSTAATSMPAKRQARRARILIVGGIVLMFLTWAMTYPPLCFLGGKYCK
jgi:hypothetical protein